MGLSIQTLIALKNINKNEIIVDSYYDTFWDSFQDNGNRSSYDFGFMGTGWNDTTLKPKYNFNFIGDNNSIFRATKIVDLKGVLAKCGIYELDFTQSTTTNYIFRDSSIINSPKIIVGANTTLNGMLPYAEKLETIVEFNINNNNYNTFRLDYCYALKELNISGELVAGIYITHSPNITVEDAINTIMHLKDYGADEVNMYKYTISFHADVWARLDDLGSDVSPFGNSWRDYVSDLGWLTA